MASPKRKPFEREHDLELISSLYLRGYSCRAIAGLLGKQRPYTLSHVSINRDIKALVARWRESSLGNISELRAGELARLGEVEAAAWRQFERSTEPSTKTVTNPDGTQTITTETRVGDARLLTVIQNVIDTRLRLLGISKPSEPVANQYESIQLVITPVRPGDPGLHPIRPADSSDIEP